MHLEPSLRKASFFPHCGWQIAGDLDIVLDFVVCVTVPGSPIANDQMLL